jgi:hypothetical protein
MNLDFYRTPSISVTPASTPECLTACRATSRAS